MAGSLEVFLLIDNQLFTRKREKKSGVSFNLFERALGEVLF